MTLPSEMDDPERHVVHLPDLRTRDWRLRLRAWAIRKLAGDALVVCNCVIVGGIANRYSADYPNLSHVQWVPVPDVDLLVIHPALDQRVTW